LPDTNAPGVFDVTIPLQCLVKESKLLITDATKVCLLCNPLAFFFTSLNLPFIPFLYSNKPKINILTIFLSVSTSRILRSMYWGR